MTGRLTGQAAILITTDFQRALAFWTEKAGFKVNGVFDEPPGFAILERDGCRVMIGLAKVPHEVVPYWKIRPGLWNAYFWVEGVDALYAEMRGRGAPIDYEICDQPYGVREFGLQDPDGHDIAFGEVMRG